MYMVINVPTFILRKGESYYVGGVAVWSGIRTNAARFNAHDVKQAKALMHASDSIVVEEA